MILAVAKRDRYRIACTLTGSDKSDWTAVVNYYKQELFYHRRWLANGPSLVDVDPPSFYLELEFDI